MRPQKPLRSKKAPVRRAPLLDPRIFPRAAETGTTADRKSVRESVHLVKAPRQTRRQFERSAKKKS